jgi:threonyl-tRNA synthetase
MPNDKLNNLRHSTAHLLAAAVLELHPGTKRAIGPAIETGFYYDFDFGDKKIADEDLPKIEQKMREIAKIWDSFERIEVDNNEAMKQFNNEPYKLELIEEFSKDGQTLTIYKSGNYSDLCRGGHTPYPKNNLKHFKLLSIAGAYWRGDEKNKMLTRIYGTAFSTKQELEDYLTMLEEAKKRDHRKLGRELDLFVFSDLVGKGLPLFTPRGTLLRELINDFSQSLRIKRGYQKVWIPHITKNDLYKVSGHWDKFGDELFLVQSQETSDQMVMKPMNCPHHQQIYASKPRSYRDLPIKYLETTTIYRDEKAGELNGLSRVRSATQDDSHVFCRPDQIKAVYSEMIAIVQEFYSAINMTYRARLSFRDPTTPEKYLGEVSLWETAQNILLEVAKENNLDYFIAEGEAAFYGPKIDFMVQDALGREWQLGTPQLDFVQPKRFGISYVDQEGKEQTPVMLHFALAGALERFLSVYIEHTAGAFPLWLAPLQVELLPIADRHIEYAESIYNKLLDAGIRVSLNRDKATLQSKIRDATLQKVPFMGIIGDKETQNGELRTKNINEMMISVRSRDGRDLGQLSLADFLQQLQQQIDKKA